MSALSSNLVPIFQTSQKLEHTVNLFDNISIRACYGPSPAHHCSRLVLGASKQSLNKNQKHKCLVILYDSKGNLESDSPPNCFASRACNIETAIHLTLTHAGQSNPLMNIEWIAPLYNRTITTRYNVHKHWLTQVNNDEEKTLYLRGFWSWWSSFPLIQESYKTPTHKRV